MRQNTPHLDLNIPELTSSKLSQLPMSPLEILRDVICAEPEFKLLGETLGLYTQEVARVQAVE